MTKKVQNIKLTKSVLQTRIHDFVNGSAHSVNATMIFVYLKREGLDVTIDDVREAVRDLVDKGFLVDAKEPTFYAVC